jgi:hypothetical protein
MFIGLCACGGASNVDGAAATETSEAITAGGAEFTDQINQSSYFDNVGSGFKVGYQVLGFKKGNVADVAFVLDNTVGRGPVTVDLHYLEWTCPDGSTQVQEDFQWTIARGAKHSTPLDCGGVTIKATSLVASMNWQ